jgi:hypothetical protein
MSTVAAEEMATKPPHEHTVLHAIGHRVAHVAPPTAPLSHGGETIKTSPFRAKNSPQTP